MTLTPGSQVIAKVLLSEVLQAPNGDLQYSPASQIDADEQRQRDGSADFEPNALHDGRLGNGLQQAFSAVPKSAGPHAAVVHVPESSLTAPFVQLPVTPGAPQL